METIKFERKIKENIVVICDSLIGTFSISENIDEPKLIEIDVNETD